MPVKPLECRSLIISVIFRMYSIRMFPFSIVFRFVLHWAANPRTLWNPSTPSHIVVIVAERFVCRFMRRIHHVLSHCAIIPNIKPIGRAIRKCFVVALSLSRFFLVSCASRTLTIVRLVFFNSRSPPVRYGLVTKSVSLPNLKVRPPPTL